MLDKISQALNDLSGAERKVAECALSEPKWFVHAAVAEIAERATVSQPTVIRFCRTLGYKGLPEFKLALSAGLGSEGMPLVHEELNADDDMGGVVEKVLGRRVYRYDKKGDNHYDVISAFIKSMRGSDPDAVLYYLARMIEAGEDPVFIARRIIICAAEDVGLADPQALVVANAAAQAAHMVGFPEARIILSEAALYIALAPKSNSAYVGIDAAIQAVRHKEQGEVPKHLRDAHYGGAKQLGHGMGYRYAHDYPKGYVDQQYLPDALINDRYYTPVDRGCESTFVKDWKDRKK